MNQALLSIENEVMVQSNSEASWIPQEKSFHESDREVGYRPVTHETLSAESTPALLFFWDGKKVIRIKDEQLKEEMARMTDYSF